MARIGESGELLKCSFCGKSQKQVQELIAGPGVYICNKCVGLCCEIIDEEAPDSARRCTTRSRPEIPVRHWIESAERQETIKLVDEARQNLEHVLSLLALRQPTKEF